MSADAMKTTELVEALGAIRRKAAKPFLARTAVNVYRQELDALVARLKDEPKPRRLLLEACSEPADGRQHEFTCVYCGQDLHHLINDERHTVVPKVLAEGWIDPDSVNTGGGVVLVYCELPLPPNRVSVRIVEVE